MRNLFLLSVMVFLTNVMVGQILQSDTLKIGIADDFYGNAVYSEVKKDICTFYFNGVGNVTYESATSGYSGYMVRQSFPEREENGNVFYSFYDRGKDAYGYIYVDANIGYIKIMYKVQVNNKPKVKVYYYQLKTGQ
jgi:hypothetical protein